VVIRVAGPSVPQSGVSLEAKVSFFGVPGVAGSEVNGGGCLHG